MDAAPVPPAREPLDKLSCQYTWDHDDVDDHDVDRRRAAVDFAPDPRTQELAHRLRAFVRERVIPSEPIFAQQAETSGWSSPAVMEELKSEARSRGLWNLFLPPEHFERHGYGANLTN